MESLEIKSPVSSVFLQADVLTDGMEAGRDLLGEQASATAVAALLERLRAHPGVEAVHGLRRVAGHRPESAWEAVSEPGTTAMRMEGNSLPGGPRPLWILQSPRPLGAMAGRPVCRGALDLERGPERIETGWWDGGDIRRDYYVARHRCGMRLWVFQDRRDGGWYLHGLFG